MHKLLIATAAVALATLGTASAADLAYKAPPPAPPPPSWTGCYVDAGVGYGMFNQSHYLEDLPTGTPLTESANTGGEGWLGRFGGGCDYQFNGSFVVGAFADYDWRHIHGTFEDTLLLSGNDENNSSAWHVGGRVGWLPYPNLMTFVSGGYTQARFDAFDWNVIALPTSPAIPLGLPQTTYNGWFIGGGYEYRIPWFSWNGLYWKTEYRYASYQAADVPIIFTPTGASTGLGERMQKDIQTVTTSLVWKFNWGGPVVARY
jgi:outer membrane immunogenic protein